MSYIASIRRENRDPILESELRELIGEDPELEIVSLPEAPAMELLFHWTQSDGQPFAFLLSQGQIDSTTTPSNAVLRKMQSLARSLAAKLVGEEGEDLTDVELPQFELEEKTAVGCYLVAAAVLALATWWLFFK